MAKSPAVILFDSNGVAMAVEDGLAIPVGTQGLLAAGSDGFEAHVIQVDANGRPVVVGSGTEGSPTGGILTVQGASGGQPVPVKPPYMLPNANGSTSTPLGPFATFDSLDNGAIDVTGFAAISVYAQTTKDSNLDGLQFFWSQDGASWTNDLRFTVRGGIPTWVVVGPKAKLFRVGYMNGPVAQEEFWLVTTLLYEVVRTDTVRISDVVSAESPATLVKSVIAGVSTEFSGQYVDVAVTPTGALNVAGISTLARDLTLTDGSQTTRITGADGLSTAAIKLGSTPVTSADPALVVGISPNNTVQTTERSVGPNVSAPPGSSTQVAGTDAFSTGLYPLRMFDGNSSGLVQHRVLGTMLRKGVNNATVEAATLSDPLRVDPTGNTTQPISASSLPLPTGAATEATLATRLTESTFTACINTLGQKAMAASTPVVLASNQTAIPITDNLGSLTVDTTQLPAALVAGRLDTSVGAWLGSTSPTVGQKTMAASLPVAISSDQSALAVTAGSLPLPAGAATEATLATRVAEATFTARINTQGQKAMAGSTPVVLASDQTAIPISDGGGSLTVDGAVTANIGTTNGLALDATLTGGTARTRITDGTSNVAVKSASAAAVASDPALVVAISPNNTITTSNASVGTNNAALPASSTAVGGSDGTNLQAVRVFDGDTGGGTQYVLGAILRKSAAGGTVESGTSTDPLRTDPTGATTQPVSGTVTANIGTSGGLALDATLTGGTAKAIIRGGAKGATAAADVTSTAEGADHQAADVQIYHGGSAVNPTQIRTLTTSDVVTAAQGTAAGLAGYWPVRVTDGTNTLPTADVAARSSFHRVTDGTNTAAVKAASTAAVAADPALVVAVSPNNSVAITAASLPLPTGAATEATLATRLAEATFTARVNTLGQKTAASSTPVVLASDQSAVPITDNAGSLTVDSTQLPAALVGGRLDSNLGSWLGSTAPTVGQKTSANSIPIVIASDQSSLATAVVGTHANAWNAVLTGTNGNSTAVDCQYTPYVSVFGNASGTTTISIQASQNNTNYYTVDQITISAVGGGDFGGNYMIGARYVRLQSSTSRNVTATIAGKA